jgi:hypothetical protein
MRLAYFVDRSQDEDLDFTRSLLPRYYPHLAVALARPLVLRPSVRMSALQLVASTRYSACGCRMSRPGFSSTKWMAGRKMQPAYQWN